jgi:TonB family protein
VTFLIDFGIKGAVALGFAFLVAVALRRGSASVRYAMWTCALTAVLVLPVVSSIGPRWSFSRSAWRRATLTASDVAQAAPSVSVVVHARRPAAQGLPMMIWIAGVMAMLARVGFGHWRVRSMFGAAKKIRDSEWVSAAQESAASIGFRRAVVLKLSTATDVPLSYGLIRATVLLPGESEHWTEERRRIVLSHEMIHARRLDSVWGLLAQCALAVNWFNPLAWLAIRQFRKEQERSCDDAVVAAGTASTVYASHLVDLARSIAIPEPALGMAERFDLEGRVHALLDSTRRRKAASRKMCAAMFLAALALIVPLAAVRAQAVSKPQAADASGAAAPIPAVLAKSAEDSKPEVAIHKAVRRTPVRESATASEEPQTTPPSGIKGSVYDPSGAVIPSATITLKNTATSKEEVVLTASDGSYQMQGLPAGEYLVKVRARGFATYQVTLELEAGPFATMNAHLAIGDGEESMLITAARPERVSAAGATPQPTRVGGMVQPYNLIKKVTPTYPPTAKAEGVEGTVLLRAIISKSGSLLSIVPVNSSIDPRLVSAAMDSVSQWLYQPTLLNGEPVEVVTTITVAFRLN